MLKYCYNIFNFLFRDLKLEDTYFNRELEQIVMTSSKPLFLSKTQTTLTLSTLIGNMYTSSLYGGLISLLVRLVP